MEFSPRKGDIYLKDGVYYLLYNKKDDAIGYVTGTATKGVVPDDFFGVDYITLDREIITILFPLKVTLRFFSIYNEKFVDDLITNDNFVTNIGLKGLQRYYDKAQKLLVKSVKDSIKDLEGIVIYETEEKQIYLVTDNTNSKSKKEYKIFKGNIAHYEFLIKEFNTHNFYRLKGIREKGMDYALDEFYILIDTGSGRNYSSKEYDEIFIASNYRIIGRVSKEQIEEFLNIFTSECKVDNSEVIVIIKPGQLYLLNGSTTGVYIEEVNKSTGMIKFKQVEIMLNDVEQEKPIKKRFIYESRELYILMKQNNRVFDLGIHTKGMNIELESRYVNLSRYEEMIKKNQLVLYCSDFKI